MRFVLAAGPSRTGACTERRLTTLKTQVCKITIISEQAENLRKVVMGGNFLGLLSKKKAKSVSNARSSTLLYALSSRRSCCSDLNSKYYFVGAV